MGPRRWQRVGWAVPWLVWQVFPALDLVTTERPTAVRLLGAAGLAAFTTVYLVAMAGMSWRRSAAPPWRALALVAVLGVALAVGFGPSWAGLLIYLSAAASALLPQRWVWPAVAAAAAVCAAVVLRGGVPGMLVLAALCPLTAFGLHGTRYLVSVNAQLVEAREELARNAVAEERLRFARDLHDLLGHSLSLIALKSELAGRLAERDPARAREEMADVEAAARRALAEVRDAVSGYRSVSCAQALAEARSALSAAGIALRAPLTLPPLPAPADAALGWVVREATTNVLRHSAASSVTVEVVRDAAAAELTVTDDGEGPVQLPAGVPAGGTAGSGLSGLRERLAALGGELDAGAAAGHGFRLRARVPLAVPAPTATPTSAAAPLRVAGR